MTRKQLINLITAAERNPDAFSPHQLKQISQLAHSYGYDFDPRFSIKRAAESFGFNLLDTLLFGALPNEWAPETANPWEDVAGTVGDLAGIFVPFGGPALVAGKLGKGLANLGAKGMLGSLMARDAMQPILKGIGEGFGFGASYDMLENGPDLGEGVTFAAVGGALPAIRAFRAGEGIFAKAAEDAKKFTASGAISEKTAEERLNKIFQGMRDVAAERGIVKYTDYLIDEITSLIEKGEYKEANKIIEKFYKKFGG